MSVILKAVQGSFHQGNSMFGDSAGKQCACCSLLAISFTVIRTPGYWNKDDLDFVVKEGDNTYKTVACHTIGPVSDLPINLSVPDLPRNIPILGSNIRIAYLKDCYGFISFNESSSLLSDMQCSSGNGFLFFLKG